MQSPIAESERAKFTEVMDWCSFNQSIQGNPLFTLPDPPILRTGMPGGQSNYYLLKQECPYLSLLGDVCYTEVYI